MLSTVQEIAIGLGIGFVFALPTQFVLGWLRLRWTWALFPAAAGALLVWAGFVESWAVGMAFGGVLTARWAFMLERRAREAGGDQRRAAKEIVGPGDVLAKRRSLKLIRKGQLIADHQYLLGYGSKSRPGRCASAERLAATACCSARPGAASPTRCCGVCPAISRPGLGRW